MDLRWIYDVGGGFGGAFIEDKLWYYTAHRFWGTSNFAANNWFNGSADPLLYVPDLDRRAFNDITNEDHTIRITWQATQKAKISGAFSLQNNC